MGRSLISVISFDLNDNSQKLKIVDINNPEKQIDVIGANKIIKEFFGASWSPDGKRLIILGKQSENPDLSLYIVDTETFSDGYFLPSSSAGKYQAPLAWSSNGKWIATREISSENPFGLIIVDARNGETILNASKLLGKILSWQWSDDGKKILCVSIDDKSPNIPTINILDVENGNLEVVEYPSSIGDYISNSNKYFGPIIITITW